MPPLDRIVLTPAHLQEMRAHVDREAPMEACGLVAGLDGRSLSVFEVPNQLQSPYRYRMEPRRQVRLLHRLQDLEWDLLAIYHSHPGGPPAPSGADLAEAEYPEAVHLIWSKIDGQWVCRGYIMENGNFREIEVHVG